MENLSAWLLRYEVQTYGYVDAAHRALPEPRGLADRLKAVPATRRPAVRLIGLSRATGRLVGMNPANARLGIAVALTLVLTLSVAAVVAVAAPRDGAGSSPALKRGKVLFVAACGSCHTLKAAGTKGTSGPNLASEDSSYAEVVSQVRRGGEGMPSFGRTLTRSQIAKLAAFVAASSGG